LSDEPRESTVVLQFYCEEDYATDPVRPIYRVDPASPPPPPFPSSSDYYTFQVIMAMPATQSQFKHKSVIAYHPLSKPKHFFLSRKEDDT